MPQLTDQGLEKINELSRRYGVSTNAVMTLLIPPEQQWLDGAV